jgi:hypothetical protein
MKAPEKVYLLSSWVLFRLENAAIGSSTMGMQSREKEAQKQEQRESLDLKE